MNDLDDFKAKILELVASEDIEKVTPSLPESIIQSAPANLTFLSQKIMADSKINPFIQEVAKVIKLSPKQEIELFDLISTYISSINPNR